MILCRIIVRIGLFVQNFKQQSIHKHNNPKNSNLNKMRRTSGPQQPGLTFFIRKQQLNKNKSPSSNALKAKSRGKLINNESSGSGALIGRKNSSFGKTEQNQSSTFFTQNGKTKKSLSENKKVKDLRKFQKQIMQVLNSSACVIQREWRKYLIRKYKKQLQFKNVEKIKIQPLPQPQFDTVSGRTSQYSEAYNNKKYYSCQNSENKRANQNSFNKNVFSFNLSSSKAPKIVRCPQKLSNTKIQEDNFTNEVVELKHNRTRSDHTALNALDLKISQKKQEKHLQIATKIINVVIEAEEHKINDSKPENSKNTEQLKYEDHYIKTQKGSIDQILTKLQKRLQQKKLKKILALQNSFSNNLMTFRSYKKNVDAVSQQHDKKLTILQTKKKKLLAKLNQFVSLCEQNLEQLQSHSQKPLTRPQNLDPTSSIKKFPQDQTHQLDISFNQQVSGFNSRTVMMEDWQTEVKIQNEMMLMNMNMNMNVNERRNDEIFIDDSGRDITIIDELISEGNLELEGGSTGKKEAMLSQLIEPREIFNTPPKILDQSLEKLQKYSIEQKIVHRQDKIQQKPVPEIIKPSALQNNKLEQLKQVKSQSPNPKKLSPQQLQSQLQKFHPIKPTIDIVNTWLLQISHFILDNFGPEFSKKLIYIEQPPVLELMRHCVTGEPFLREYTTISQKIFKQFQFFHIKGLLAQERVEGDRKESYSALMYTFHQALYDCLNRMLLDQLIQGRNWVNYPWSCQFKVRKLVGPDHSKQCLQKAINRVSNLSDYNIQPIIQQQHQYSDTGKIIDMGMGRQFEQTQHNLIFAEEVKEISLNFQIERGNLMYRLAIFMEGWIMEEGLRDILKVLY